MALALKDRVKETTTTTGTGTVTLAGAAAGFQSFAAVGDGNQTFYAIADATSGDWEVGIGTYTSSGTTLSRTTVVSSSNAGSLVNFGAGSKDVFVTYPSSRAVYLDAAGSAVTTLDIGTLGTSTANISTANITAGTVATAPMNNTDIVNKEYADAIASGIHFHEAVNLATTAALPANTYNNGTSGVGATLTGNANGVLSVDSTLTIVADRILVKNEVAGANNGVYVVTQVGSAGTPYILTRSTDMDSVGTGVDQIDEGDFFLVTGGTANVNTAWVQQTPPPITIGTTPLVFQQFSAPITYTAGTGLNESPSYTFNIANIGTAGTYGSASSVPVITTNAQGQVTGVTPTAIAISGAAVSGNISGQAGSVANALTAGTYLTSGGTFDGSAARTFAVDATDVNTASKVVARDASGNFSAGTITATLSGAATSATTATNLAGGAANQLAYQTGAGATAFATAPSASNQVLNWNGSAFTWSAGTISGIPLGSNLSTLTFGTYLTGTSYNGSTAVTLATNATNLNTASTIVARDASGDFTAGTITAALSGNATTATSATSATSATTATNLAGGSAGTVPYQSAAGTTVQLAAGTSGQLLQSNGAAAPSWVTAATRATNLAGGGPGQIPFQTTTNITTFLSAGTSGQVLTSQGIFGPTWTTATDANTGYTIVARDASGNFSAGTITASLNGNASTATTASNVNNGTLTMNVSGTGLSGSQTFTANQSSNATFTVTSNATNANTVSTIVARDSNGDFNAGAINITRGLTSDPSGSQALRVVSPGSASFYTASANGALQIQLPSAFGAGTTMLRMRISVWTFDGQSFDIFAGAYLYNLGVLNNFAYMLTGSRPALNTRWGWDGSRFSFFIGDIGNFWSYPTVNVTDVQVGFNSYAASTWTSGWNIQANNSSYGTVLTGPTLTTSLATTATTATTASNLAGGSAGTIPYQSAAGTTVQLAAGTSGQVLRSNGAAAPSWLTATNANTASAIVQRDASGNFSAGTITAALSGTATTATTATNLAGGSAGTVPYQSAAGTTVQLAAGSSGQFLRSNGAAAPSWATPSVTPAGSNQQIQFNNAGSFGASSNLTWDGTKLLVGSTWLWQPTNFTNVGVGNATMINVTGSSNTAVGTSALESLSSGVQNTAVGRNAGAAITSGGNNAVLGFEALRFANASSRNIAIGATAMYTCVQSSDNVAIGYESLYALSPSGTPSNGFNVAIGPYSGRSATSATSSVIVGYNAGYFITTGNRNTCLGPYAGHNISTGSGNISIGGLNAAGGNNPVFSITTQSNYISMGTGAVTNAYVQVAWTVVSDARDKTDFAPVPHGLDFVTKLKPTAYRFKESRDATEGHGPLRYGFKAQDILELEGDNPVVIDAGTPEKLYFNDQNLLAILVKAVQEQQVIIDQLKADVAALKGN